MPEAARVVLDTNVLLSLFVFADSRYARLRERLTAGELIALTDGRCLGEFRRVLAYPMFSLADAAQRAAFDAYSRSAGSSPPPPSRSPCPNAATPTIRSFSKSRATAMPTGWSPPTRRC
jgi:hypothetical protein